MSTVKKLITCLFCQHDFVLVFKWRDIANRGIDEYRCFKCGKDKFKGI